MLFTVTKWFHKQRIAAYERGMKNVRNMVHSDIYSASEADRYMQHAVKQIQKHGTKLAVIHACFSPREMVLFDFLCSALMIIWVGGALWLI